MLFTEEVVKFVFREEGFQHPLKEDKEEAFVELLVLEHVKDVEGALAYGVCAHHGAHLICQRHHQYRKHFHQLFSLAICLSFLLLLTICPPPPKGLWDAAGCSSIRNTLFLVITKQANTYHNVYEPVTKGAPA